MAAEINGTFRLNSVVKRVFRETSLGRTSEKDGIRDTSSKVRASPITFMAGALHIEYGNARIRPGALAGYYKHNQFINDRLESAI